MKPIHPMTEQACELRWLRRGAYLTIAIALITILLLSVEQSRAANPTRPTRPSSGQPARQGFQPGQKQFNNPFPNRATTDSAEGDDEQQVSINPGGSQTDDSDVPDPKIDESGVSVGGGKPGGIENDRPLSAFNIDDNTGSGSKAIVTDFNYPDAEILDIAKTLGKLTGKNFILDKNVKGRVTIVSNSPITVGDAWRAFLTALDINGFAMIPSGKYIRIARQRDARDKQLETYVGKHDSPDTDALITRVFPLKYISADEVARTFRSFMPANSRIIPYDQTNTVIVTDTGSNIAKLAKMLKFLDVEGFEATIEVIPVKYTSAVEISKLVDTLIPGTNQPTARGGRPSGSFGRGSNFASRRTKQGGIINTVIADERTNNLIIHANKKGADEVRRLVIQLDKKLPPQRGGGKIHVVYLQFADSEKIAATLNALSTTTTEKKAPTGAAGGGGVGVNPTETVLFEGSIKVSPDKSTNSLVITASPSDFSTVQRVIHKLDIPRDEVFVEALIMEMQLGRNFNFSASAMLPTKGVGFLPNTDLADFLANPISQKGVIFGFKEGVAKELTVGTQKVTVNNLNGLIKILQTNTKANVLATPQILTLDNAEATFETSEKIPVLTTTSNQGGVAQSTTKEPISLSISIKPQINKFSNFVKLDIKTKMEDISQRELPSQIQNLALATFERKAETSVVVADADTVVLGGLVRDKVTETVAKIPLLGDIPILGWLFSSRQTESVKTNLLIFITPHIVRQYEKIRTVLDRKLKERDDFIETYGGGEDIHRPYRDQMIKNLPDINTIMSYKPKSTVSIGDEDEALPDSPATTGGGYSSDQSVPEASSDIQNNLAPPPPPLPPDAPEFDGGMDGSFEAPPPEFD